MKLTILGTANAWGVNELAGTPWPSVGVLSTGREVPFRKYRSSLLVESADGKKVLVDCGPDFPHQRRDFGVGRIDAVVLTHPHLDHIGGLDELNVYHRPERGPPVPLYATAECWRTAAEFRGFGYLAGKGGVEVRELAPEQPLTEPRDRTTFGTLRITPFGVEHSASAPGSVGFVFEETEGERWRLIYTGDFWSVSNPASALFDSPADVLVCECDRWAGPPAPNVGGGHMSFEGVVGLLTTGVFSRARPKQLVLTHFGDAGPKGYASGYRDWREGVVNGLAAAGLNAVTPDEDSVIAHDGLEIIGPPRRVRGG